MYKSEEGVEVQEKRTVSSGAAMAMSGSGDNIIYYTNFKSRLAIYSQIALCLY